MQATCVNCKAPFPANREFATIPDAARIAFDPAHPRVWRICAKCGEWNLLGTEASERALPELEARFAAAPKRAGGEGFAPAHIGSALELLRIGATVAAANDAVLRKRRKQLTAAKWLTIAGLSVVGLTFLALGMFEYHMHGLAQMLSTGLVSGSMVYLTYARMQRHQSVPYNPKLVALVAALGLTGLVLCYLLDHLSVVAWLPVVLLASVVSRKARAPSLLTVSVPGGEPLRIYSRRDLKQLSISWNSDGELTVHGFPNHAEVTGARALVLLRTLIPVQQTLPAGRAVSDAAYDLVRTAGGLKGVLRALDGFRDDNSGRVVLADLPKVYLVALDLALAKRELGDPPDDDGAIAAKSAEAAAIAAEAESLIKR